MSDTYYIDDQDLSKVVYNGSWVRGGTANEYDGTVASSTRVGDSFTVTFKGISVAVYGTLDSTSGGVVTSYSMDGAPASNATAQAGVGDTYRQQFWSSQQFSLAVHRLHVTMMKVNYDPQQGEGTIWFDYFLVTDPTITSQSTTPLTPSSTNPPIINVNKSAPVGAIAGGVIGGLSLILAAILILLFYRRARAKPSPETLNNTLPHDPNNRYTTIHPFPLDGRNTSEIASSSRTSNFDRTTLMSGKYTASNLNTDVSVHPDTPVSSSPTTTTIPGKHARAYEHSDPPTFSLQQSDNSPVAEVSGARPPLAVQLPEAPADMPPVYTPV